MKQQEVIGFHFQVIPLEEAKSAAIAGSGNYAELKAKLLDALPLLHPHESFAFGLPKGEVAEDQRRGIILACNATLKRAQLNWKITYSGTKKLFICIPKTETKHTEKREKTNGTIPKPARQPDVVRPLTIKAMIDDAMQIFKVTDTDIKKGLGVGKKVRKAICIVGRELGIDGNDIAGAVGLTPAGVYFNSRRQTKYGANELAQLRAFYGRKQ